MVAPTSFFFDNGCHVRILEEIKALQEGGHKVTVCTYHMGHEVEGITIKRSLDVPWKRGAEVGSSRHKLYFDAMLAVKSLQVALQEKPDIIHAHLHEGTLIGGVIKLLKFNRVPLIFDFQGSMTSEMIDHNFLDPEGFFYRPALMVEKVINRLPDLIVTSTYNSARLLKEEFKVSPDRVITLADRVNSNTFRPHLQPAEKAVVTQLRAGLGIPVGRKVVIYLGVLAPYQGTDVLLQAATLLKHEAPDLHFLVMGYPGVDSYRELANYLGIGDRVTFPGRIPYRDAAHFLALGDIAVAPKMSATEGAGKITNYMAMGLPTVAFDTPVARELMGDLGIYAALGDARSLADKIKLLADNETLAAELGPKLRHKAIAEMSWINGRAQLESIYELVLNRYRKTSLPTTTVQAGNYFSADSSLDSEPVSPKPVNNRKLFFWR
jgi:glycosyltransferase involved in cell wall biosynthesis